MLKLVAVLVMRCSICGDVDLKPRCQTATELLTTSYNVLGGRATHTVVTDVLQMPRCFGTKAVDEALNIVDVRY